MNAESTASKIFRTLYLSDLEAGLHRTKEEYLELFEGFEEIVEKGYERLVLEEDGERPTVVLPLPIGNPGDRISHYEIIRELGRGGQAIVYLAHDEKLNRKVALKVLTRTGPGSEGTLQRFEREAEVCSKLDHPSICTVFEAGVARGIPFIAMQFIEGDTLSRRIAETCTTHDDDDEDEVFFDTSVAPGDAEDVLPSGRAGGQPDRDDVDRMVRSFEQAARALHAAHEADVIHRDIKPGNIMIAPNGRPVLLDFGLAQDSNERLAALTMTGDFFGTPAYMSPEQLSAHRIRLDRRTDVFSLAVTLYEAVTGQRPFESATREGLYQAILTKDALDAHRVNRAVSRDLSVVLQKAMEKDRDRRYATAAELADELERIRRGEPILARPLGSHQRVARWVQRNKLPAGLIALLFGVVIGAGIFLEISSQRREARAVAKQAEEKRAARDRIRAQLRDVIAEAAAEIDDKGLNVVSLSGRLQSIVRYVVTLQEDGFDFVVGLHDSENQAERIISCFTLPFIPDERGPEILAEMALKDPERRVRLWASQHVMLAEHPDIVAILNHVLDETEDEEVRVNTIFGLCHNGTKRGFAEALRFYRDENASQSLKSAMGQSAALLRSPEMMPLVVEWMWDLSPNESLRHRLAIGYLADVGGEQALAELRKLRQVEALPDEIHEKIDETIEKLTNNVE